MSDHWAERVGELNRRIHELESERDELKRERDEARRSLVARVITRQQSDCSDWTAGDVLIQGRIYADQCWGPGTGAELFPEEEP